MVFYVPFDLLKIYLAFYFWRLSMSFLELMTLSNPNNLCRFTILLFLILVYQTMQNLFMIVYWIYPAISNFFTSEKPPMFTLFADVTLFFYMSTGLIQGWIMLGYVHFIWKSTQNLEDVGESEVDPPTNWKNMG